MLSRQRGPYGELSPVMNEWMGRWNAAVFILTVSHPYTLTTHSHFPLWTCCYITPKWFFISYWWLPFQSKLMTQPFKEHFHTSLNSSAHRDVLERFVQLFGTPRHRACCAHLHPWWYCVMKWWSKKEPIVGRGKITNKQKSTACSATTVTTVWLALDYHVSCCLISYLYCHSQM